MYAVLIVLVCLLVSAQAALNATVTGRGLPTVTTLNLPQYLGFWYQVYADPAVLNTFEKDAYCSIALYGDNGDGTISVHNAATIGAPAGTPYTIDGYAYTPDPSQPGQLKVHFDASDAFPFDAPYWILQVGPVNADNQYDYAIVSDSTSFYLFVMARDVATYYAKYDADVQKQLAAWGFTGATRPIKTYQGPDCAYESNKRKAQIAATAAAEAAAKKK